MRNYLSLISCVALIALSCEAAPDSTTRPTTQPRVIQPDANGKVIKTDAEWKKLLNAEQFHILREKGTEPAYSNAYWDNHDNGTYFCAGCGNELYTSETKFDSGTGWPSFFKPLNDKSVQITKDADGQRDEVLCWRCGGHLGHVFDDGPAPTGQRFCMDSAAMVFVKSK